MKLTKLIILLFLVFINPLLADPSAQERWYQFALDSQNSPVVELSLKTRGHEFSDEMEDKLSAILIDFTQGNSIEEASLLAFKQLTGENFSPKLIDFQGLKDPDKEKHRDIVILIKDFNDNPLMVMKWFRTPYHFLSEISAMEKLHHLSLTQSEVISPLAVGKATYNDQTLYLLIETAAKGETLISLINALANPGQGSKKRESVDTALKSLAAQAQALAEIHAYTHNEGSSMVSDPNSWNLDEIAAQLNELNKNLSIDDLLPIIKTLREDYFAVEHAKRYRLGDPNWGNFLYDDSNSQLTIIDVNFMNFALDSDGLPTDDAAEDYVVVMNHFWFFETILKEEEYQLLLSSFNETYRTAAGNNGPTDLELTYAYVNNLMSWIQGQVFFAQDKGEEAQDILSQVIIPKLKQVIEVYKSSKAREVAAAA